MHQGLALEVTLRVEPVSTFFKVAICDQFQPSSRHNLLSVGLYRARPIMAANVLNSRRAVQMSVYVE